MASKEKRYDPLVMVEMEYDSGLSDTESDCVSLDDRLEDFLSHPRLGGPQADNDGSKKGASSSGPRQKVGNCRMPKCKKKNVPLFKGNCYPCHRSKPERQRQHNFMCEQCASGEDTNGDVLVCFAHSEQAEVDEEDPEPAMEDD